MEKGKDKGPNETRGRLVIAIYEAPEPMNGLPKRVLTKWTG
jgi:hypothetical protein